VLTFPTPAVSSSTEKANTNTKVGELPAKDNQDYEYNLVSGLEGYIAPPGSSYMTHLYKNPEDAVDDTLCFEAFPKKKNAPVYWIRGQANIAWGVYIKEEPDKIFFMIIKCSVALPAGLIFGIAWNVVHGSDQRAFPWTVVTWITVVIYLILDVCEEWLKQKYLTPTIKEKDS
jgi:hypothetical protein